jgi:GNAT superfamily N-acetyltransferase
MATWTVDSHASPADIDAILAIEEASFTNPWTRDMYLAEFENEGVSFFYLAKDASGLVVGFCSFWRVLDELHINNLAVAPAERGGGVGRRCSRRSRRCDVRRPSGDARGAPVERSGAMLVREAGIFDRRRQARLLHEARRGRSGAVA